MHPQRLPWICRKYTGVPSAHRPRVYNNPGLRHGDSGKRRAGKNGRGMANSTKGVIKGGSKGKDDSGAMKSLVQVESLIQLALLLPAATVIGWLIGVGLDRWLHQ